MDALGQLTGGIAHDFNNLLTGIIGSLDIVRRRMGDGRAADISRFMDAASASALRAAALTHRLLAFAPPILGHHAFGCEWAGDGNGGPAAPYPGRAGETAH